VCDVTLVQFFAEDDKKSESRRSGVPEVVMSGLAERCVGAALADLSDPERLEFTGASKKSNLRRATERRLFDSAQHYLFAIFETELADSAPVGVDDIAAHIEQKLHQLPRDRYLPGLRTRDARRSTHDHPSLSAVGSAGGQQIFIADLPGIDQQQLHQHWSGHWSTAAEPWDVQDGVELWRAGGALFAIGTEQLAGTAVFPRGIGRGGR
jgi:hypothetical protein